LGLAIGRTTGRVIFRPREIGHAANLHLGSPAESSGGCAPRLHD
jgi:hypothetical protein